MCLSAWQCTGLLMDPRNPAVNDSFKNSIHMLVSRAERQPFPLFTITQLCSEFGFQRRRLYDVINVLEAIGCCKKTSVDTLIWLHLSNVPISLARSSSEYMLDSDDCDITSLIPNNTSISMGDLALAFMLCFIAMQQRCMSLKEVANFLSRKNGRSKTTLCKLYQVSHILEAVGVITRDRNTKGFIICDPYFIHIDMKSSPLSIQSLLNRTSEEASELSKRQTNVFKEREGCFHRISVSLEIGIGNMQTPLVVI